ncbi:hypothetical protein IM660_01830 [Ruania alkalisoli]|uniref:LppX_LprAFG lipoprotein n=1 Tax=Ruania alkalisoli TaxID=2779775 RepID=A0A7M1SU24_9MICO|nr:hypothetical protein [Ruania alkalisoli]QOR71080.1 hypothetical protein IM660_01830 [Ruania alkalisoli]
MGIDVARSVQEQTAGQAIASGGDARLMRSVHVDTDDDQTCSEGACFRRRMLGMLLVMLAALGALSACSEGLDEDGEPLTIPQSEQLAAARFGLSNAGLFAATVTLGEPDSVDRFTAEITVDPDRLYAWGTLARGPDSLAVEEQVQLTEGAIAVLRDGRWQVQDQTQLLNQLRIVFALVSDRPENAQLLRQSDARYLGGAGLDGVEMSVYLLPTLDGSGGASRLWLNSEGLIRRLDSGDDQFVIQVGAGVPTSEPTDGPLFDSVPVTDL